MNENKINLTKLFDYIRKLSFSQSSKELLFVTLHYKQSSFMYKLNEKSISDTLHQIINRLSEKFYKNAFRRYNKKISSYAVIEKSRKDNSLHHHIIFQMPKHCTDIEDFIKLLTQSYDISKFAYDRYNKKRIDVRPVYDAKECLNYLHKNQDSDYAEIDTKNINQFVFS